MPALIGEAPICLTGGADGADLQFGMCAGKAGHLVVHFAFQGHRSKAPEGEIVRLTSEQLELADPALLTANKTLKRTFPGRNPFVASLLRRNWYQVKDSDRLYAVSTIKDGLVQGGTAWAVQMFIDIHPGRETFVFDQEKECWFEFDHATMSWVEVAFVPDPHGVYAGIGSRALNPAGKQAIRTLLRY